MRTSARTFSLIPVLLALTAVSTPVVGQEAPTRVLFNNVNVFDGVTDGLQNGMSVLVEGNLIAQISASSISADGATVIEGGGRTLMPGMHDQHMHMSLYVPLAVLRDDMTPMHVGAVSILRCERVLMNGFTTIRDAGGASKYLTRVIESGQAVGPRIYHSEALISQTSGHADIRSLTDPHSTLGGHGSKSWADGTVTVLADGEAQVKMAVREQLRKGATQIKIMASGGMSSDFDPIHSVQYTPSEIRAAVEAAKQWDTYVFAHVFNEAAIAQCIENGVKVLEHIPFLTEKAAKLMVEKDIMFAVGVAPVFSVSEEAAKKQYSPAAFAKWKLVRDAAEAALKTIKKTPGMVENMTIGTDVIPQWQIAVETDAKMNGEVNTMADYFEPVEILRMLTTNAARMNRMTGKLNPYTEGRLGEISVGAYADILLVDGNPLEEIKLLANPDKNLKLIMKDGKIYKNTLNK